MFLSFLPYTKDLQNIVEKSSLTFWKNYRMSLHPSDVLFFHGYCLLKSWLLHQLSDNFKQILCGFHLSFLIVLGKTIDLPRPRLCTQVLLDSSLPHSHQVVSRTLGLAGHGRNPAGRVEKCFPRAFSKPLLQQAETRPWKFGILCR